VFARLFARVTGVLHNHGGGDREAQANKKLVFEVSEQTLECWAGEVARRAPWLLAVGVCTPGFYNAEGTAFTKELSAGPDEKEQNYAKARGAMWGGGPLDYQLTVEEYMAKETSLLSDFVVDVV
jgi:hypothetical protein